MCVTAAALAKRLVGIFTAAVLGFLVWGADAPDALLLSLVFLPWLVGPAILMAFLVSRLGRTRVQAWTLLAAEVLVIVSTVAAWIALALAPDGQNGIAAMLLPVAQFGVIAAALASWLAIAAIVRLFRRRWVAR